VKLVDHFLVIFDLVIRCGRTRVDDLSSLEIHQELLRWIKKYRLQDLHLLHELEQAQCIEVVVQFMFSFSIQDLLSELMSFTFSF